MPSIITLLGFFIYVKGYKLHGEYQEKIMDEFNEFFFEETSKIPIDEIEKASREKQREKSMEKKVVSPYTMSEKPKSKFRSIIVGLIIALLLFLIIYIVITNYVIPNTHRIFNT